MFHLGLVALGGAIGAGCRHLVNLWAVRQFGASLPVGTLVVNVLGGLLMGVLAGWFSLRGAEGTAAVRLFLATGILGGFTTFSAFSLEVALFAERNEFGLAALYCLSSVVLSVGALMAGLALARTLA